MFISKANDLHKRNYKIHCAFIDKSTVHAYVGGTLSPSFQITQKTTGKIHTSIQLRLPWLG